VDTFRGQNRDEAQRLDEVHQIHTRSSFPRYGAWKVDAQTLAQDNIGLYIKITPTGTCPSPPPTAVSWSHRSGLARAAGPPVPRFLQPFPPRNASRRQPTPTFLRRPRRVRRRLDPLPYTDARLHDLRDGILVPVAGWRRGLGHGNRALNLAATHAIVGRACVVVPRRAGLRLSAPEPAWHADVGPLHQATRSQRAASGTRQGSHACAARQPGLPAEQPRNGPGCHTGPRIRSCNELAGHGNERHLAILTMPGNLPFSDSIGTTAKSGIFGAFGSWGLRGNTSKRRFRISQTRIKIRPKSARSPVSALKSGTKTGVRNVRKAWSVVCV
jgi:hypothetical protein